MHIRKEVPPADSPSTLEDVEGGNQYAVHGVPDVHDVCYVKGR